LRFDPEAVFSLDDPAVVLDQDGRVILANALFSKDLGLIEADGATLTRPLADLLSSAEAGRAARRLQIAGQDGSRIFDLFVMPLSSPGWRLVVVLDRSVDIGLQNALVHSRARFKTLVEVSSDYAWETASDGTFSMISPKGLAGVSPRDLIGSRPGELLEPSAPQVAISPFSAPVPVENAEIWMRHVDGDLLCFEVSAVPLIDEKGEWRGARGICRDVTENRKHRRFLAEQRNRERVFSRITNVFRHEADPNDMLQVAASTCTHGFGASGCQIFTATMRSEVLAPRPQLLLTVSFGNVGALDLVQPSLERVLDDPKGHPQVVSLGGFSVLLSPTVYGGRLVGVILLWRSPNHGDWTEGDRQLLASLSSQIAAAIEQRANYRLLFDASRTDPLTGLLNRRGFYDEMKRRFKRLQRDTKKASLVYLDLDNFKLVNDLHGHAKGDETLCFLADILRHNTRSTDLVSRLGGDEFAVWLDNADETVAINRAQVFLAAAGALIAYSGAPDRPLKLSIGIAVHDPKSPEGINEFVSRADVAMYSVKRAGKGSYAVAAPAVASGARR
ncbi:MAG TPA: diguanylate cyclase, partial [Telmatospirillum sp.]|nr:diguanylate cyclase [Telmatospirillum sp.]